MAGTHAGGLLRRGERFYYRRRVPRELLRVLGRHEIKLALRTTKRSEAKSRAVMFAARVEGLFMALREDEEARMIARLVAEWERGLIEADREERIFGGSVLPEGEEPADFYRSLIKDEAERLVERDWRGVKAEAQAMLDRVQATLPPAGFERLCYAMQAAQLRVLKQCADERDADLCGERVKRDRSAALVASAPTEPSAQAAGPRLGEAIQKLVEQSRARWTAKTAHMIQTGLAEFVELIGDKPLAEVSRDDVMRYRAHLEGKPGRGGKKLAAGSVNKLLAGVGRLFAFAKQEGWQVQANAVAGVKLPKGNAREQRLPFTDEEVRVIFSPTFKAETLGKGQHARYWIPLVCAFSGARLEEVAQLHCADFTVENEVRVFQVRAGDGRRVKNAGSERSVPLHPRLVELGLLDFVEARQKLGAPLFPELKAKKLNGKGDAVSKWFTRWRKRAGVKDARKTFHSLRHTFQNKLAEAGVEERIIADLVGHENATMTGGRYIKRAPVGQLAAAVTRLHLRLGLE